MPVMLFKQRQNAVRPDERPSGPRIGRGGLVHSPGILTLLLVAAIAAGGSPLAAAQAPRASSDEPQQTPPAPTPQAGGAAPATRQASIEEQQAAKGRVLAPYAPSKGERLWRRADALIAGDFQRAL